MSGLDEDEVVRHFFDQEGSGVFIEKLNKDNKDRYADYLTNYERVQVNTTNQNMMVSHSRRTDIKSPQQRKAEEKAEQRLEDEDDYFLLVDYSNSTPVFGQASNILEEGATETRISIDDESYRGIQNSDGETLYDFINSVRIPEAEGTLYVCTMNKKAQYKLENTEFQGDSFQTLKWAPNFKGEYEPGTVMALEKAVGEAPEKLFLPEVDGQKIVEEFVNEKLEAFHEGPVETELKSSITYEDFTEDSDLTLNTERACMGNRCYSITDGGSRQPSDILEELRSCKEDVLGLVEARMDVEAPQTVYVAQDLLDDGWLPSGFVPNIGGNYSSYEMSFIFPNEAVNFYMTEGVRDLYDTMDIPYRKVDPDDSLEESKSVEVEVGAYPREISETGIRHSKLFNP